VLKEQEEIRKAQEEKDKDKPKELTLFQKKLQAYNTDHRTDTPSRLIIEEPASKKQKIIEEEEKILEKQFKKKLESLEEYLNVMEIEDNYNPIFTKERRSMPLRWQQKALEIHNEEIEIWNQKLMEEPTQK
jgi:hypothetical protein